MAVFGKFGVIGGLVGLMFPVFLLFVVWGLFCLGPASVRWLVRVVVAEWGAGCRGRLCKTTGLLMFVYC